MSIDPTTVTTETLVIDGQRVMVEYLRRAVIVDPDLSAMTLDTPEIVAAVEVKRAAFAAWREIVTLERPRIAKSRREYDAVLDDREFAYELAQRAVNQAVRAANPGASEAQINVASRSL